MKEWSFSVAKSPILMLILIFVFAEYPQLDLYKLTINRH